MLVALAVALVVAGCAPARIAIPPPGTGPKHVIILVAEGVGAAHLELARQASVQLRGGRGLTITDTLMKRGSVGLMTTHARDALATDAAAAATAMSTGVKTRAGMIATTPEGERLATALQAAQLSGRRIGVVTTGEATGATPAAFSVHAASRRHHDAVLDGYLRLAPDVLLGGGAARFLPAGAGGARTDGRDVVADFTAKGYTVARTRPDLVGARGARVLGLFAPYDLGHEIDRHQTGEPALADMTEAALRLLARDDGKGFVLLVTTEATDHAGHATDAAALIHDVWAFDQALDAALAFQATAPADTLVIVAGAYETGGLAPTLALASDGRGVVVTAPEHLAMLSTITMSFNRAAESLGTTPTEAAIDWLVVRHFPLFRLEPDLRHTIHHQEPFDPAFPLPTQSALGRMVSRQTGIYWASAAHSAQPVAVGALGPGAELFRGFYDNTDFGRALHRVIRGQ